MPTVSRLLEASVNLGVLGLHSHHPAKAPGPPVLCWSWCPRVSEESSETWLCSRAQPQTSQLFILFVSWSLREEFLGVDPG